MDTENILITSGIVAIVGKILWDWVYSGRSKQVSAYITRDDCDKRLKEERCQTNESTQCVIKLKQDVSSLFERVRTIEREQKESSQEIKEVHNNLNSINISLAELKSMLNSKIERIIVREDK